MEAAPGAGAGAGAGGDSETCRVLCESCSGSEEEAVACDADCQPRIGDVSNGLDLDSCPEELQTVGDCLQATGCFGQSCDVAFLTWFTCVGGVPF